MIGDELVWFLLIFWFIFLILGYKWREVPIIGFGTLIGFLFSFTLMSEIGFWYGMVCLMFNVYSIYRVVFMGVEEE